MNTYTQIKPINFPTKGIGNYIKITADSFILGSNSVPLNWVIYEDINLISSAPPLEGKIITSGTVIMADTDLQTWGSDDNVAIDFVLNKIGVIKY
jgi:hypothetical protein